MSGNATKQMLAAFIQQNAAPTTFFAGMFQVRPENVHSSSKVEIDIQRGGEDVAIAVKRLADYRDNSADNYTTKEFVPPIFKEKFILDSEDLMKGNPGETPYDNVDFRVRLSTRVARNAVKVVNKIARSIEWQGSQILQTGKVDLTDENGASQYALDFLPKSTHFATVSTVWSDAGATPLDDINAVAELNRTDGLVDQDMLIFGSDAWQSIITNETVRKQLDTTRIASSAVTAMQIMGNGGIFRGVLEIGNYRYDCYTYGGRFKHPQTGVSTPYMNPKKVIIMSSTARFDATFGAIPNIGEILGTSQRAQLLPDIPARITGLGAGGFDLFATAWTTNDGEQLNCGFGARPLLIPTEIDTFGCLTVL